MPCPASNLLSCAACVDRMALSSASFLAAAVSGSPAGAAAPPYNLLVIQTDEHNFRTLGCYRRYLARDQALMRGPGVVETPTPPRSSIVKQSS